MDIKAETANIQQHINKGNYHAGINLAISAMNACRREGDPAEVEHFLQVVEGIVATMREAFGSGPKV